ncbi:MAG: gas vesicle protein [Chloroflexi bacterium]|nr:gas vesicle protein [Chloroflexota bacterium]
MTELLERAKKQLADVTGLRPEGIVRAFKDNGGWRVGVEMLEMSRIPPATDMLGDYEVLLAEDGSMVRFERRKTRLRGEPVDEEETEMNGH